MLLVINDHFHPSNVTFRQLMETLVGTIHIIARPLEHVLGPASKKKLLPPPTVALAAMPLKDWDNSPRPGVPTTKPQAEFSRSPTPSRSSSPRPTTPRRRKASPSRPTTRREEDRSSRFDAALADTRSGHPPCSPGGWANLNSPETLAHCHRQHSAACQQGQARAWPQDPEVLTAAQASFRLDGCAATGPPMSH